MRCPDLRNCFLHKGSGFTGIELHLYMIQKIILVTLGGGLGSAIRYLVSLGFDRFGSGSFPVATFLVNLTGSLLIGLMLGLFVRQELGEGWRVFFITGICGGYTTFSAFSAENLHLLQSGQFSLAFIYSLSSVLLGVFAVFLGFYLTQS